MSPFHKSVYKNRNSGKYVEKWLEESLPTPFKNISLTMVNDKNKNIYTAVQ